MSVCLLTVAYYGVCFGVGAVVGSLWVQLGRWRALLLWAVLQGSATALFIWMKGFL